jgi:hypothetical protein
MKSNNVRQNTGRDLLLYIGIALLIAAVAGGYGVYLARKGEEPNFKNDWSVTIATAALVFGYVISIVGDCGSSGVFGLFGSCF